MGATTIPLIRAETGLSDVQVAAAIRALETDGLIECGVMRPDGLEAITPSVAAERFDALLDRDHSALVLGAALEA